MTELQQAIASGQVSAAQIEAHRAAGEMPIQMFEPRFQHTYCSQCGRDCGPGDEGFSSCGNHIADASKKVSAPQTLRETIDNTSSDDAMVMCRAGDVRAALLDAERVQYLISTGAAIRQQGSRFYLLFKDSTEQSLVYETAGDSIDAAMKGAQS